MNLSAVGIVVYSSFTNATRSAVQTEGESGPCVRVGIVGRNRRPKWNCLGRQRSRVIQHPYVAAHRDRFRNDSARYGRPRDCKNQPKREKMIETRCSAYHLLALERDFGALGFGAPAAGLLRVPPATSAGITCAKRSRRTSGLLIFQITPSVK